jgi:hypothetical protein
MAAPVCGPRIILPLVRTRCGALTTAVDVFNQDDYLLVVHHEAFAAKLISTVFVQTSARKLLARAGGGVE